MTKDEVQKLQKYLREKFGTGRINVVGRTGKDDSCEVMLGEEFVGVIFKDEEEDDLSYDFHMTILDIDLPEEV